MKMIMKNRSSGTLTRKWYLAVYIQIALQSLTPLAAMATPVNPPVPEQLPAPDADGPQAQQTARWLTEAGTLAAGKQRGEAVQQWLGNRASSAVADSAERWLSGYGNARVSLGFDRRFHFDNSSFDVLLPLNDSPGLLTFAQLGLHDKDDYTTANLGVGQRRFGAEQMFGYNLFFDQELRNNHSRLGAGLEYWRDNLKLSANGYLALSGWKNSRTLMDYQERAASGYDLQGEAYLPAWPQLGGKLAWEQYFGDEVALFGRDQRQRDPYAATVGLNYTPIPLVTAGVDYKQGKSGTNETQLNMQFNYQFGTPWAQQISSERVRQRRALSGARLDFVERNNNMVMRYKKMEVVKLTLPAQIEGDVGSQQPLQANVEAKYGLDYIQWRSDALTAAGGSIQRVSPLHYRVLLPAAAGSYPVQAVAYDRHGNASQSTTLNVVSHSPTSPQAKYHLALTPSAPNAYNNGNDPIVWTLAVTDENGGSVAGYRAKWAVVEGKATLSAATSELNKDGKTQNSLTSTAVGKVKLNVTLWDSKGEQALSEQGASETVSFVAPGTPALWMQPEKVYQRPDGQYAIDWKVHAYDAATRQSRSGAEKGLGGYTLRWNSDVGTFAAPLTKTDRDGNSTNTVISGVPGNVKVNVSLVSAGGQPLVEQNDDTTQFIGEQYQVTLQPEPGTAMADNEEAITWTVKVLDKKGQAVANAPVSWETSLGTLGAPRGQTNARGESQTTLTSERSGDAQVQVKVLDANNKLQATASGTGHFLGYQLKLTPEKTQAQTGPGGIAWSVEAKDSQGQALGNDYKVKWSLVSGKGQLSSEETPLDSRGKASTTLTSSQAGTVQLKAVLLNKGGKAVSEMAGPEVSFVDGSQITLKLTPSTTLASVENHYQVEWQADVSGLVGAMADNASDDYRLEWSTNLGILSQATTPVVAGMAKNTLTSDTKGTANVTVKLVKKDGEELTKVTDDSLRFVSYKLDVNFENMWLTYYDGKIGGEVRVDTGNGNSGEAAAGYRVHLELVPEGDMDVVFYDNDKRTIDVTVESDGKMPGVEFKANTPGKFSLVTQVYDTQDIRVAEGTKQGEVRKFIESLTLTPSQTTLKADGSDSMTLTARLVTSLRSRDELITANSAVRSGSIAWTWGDGGDIVRDQDQPCNSLIWPNSSQISIEKGKVVLTYQCAGYFGKKPGPVEFEAEMHQWSDYAANVVYATAKATINVIPGKDPIAR